MDYVIDVKNRKLGRVATEIATILQGKNKPDYQPNQDSKDKVIIKNAKLIEVSGRKKDQKKYYRYSGYPGGLKERSYQEQFEKDPTEIIRHAVKGMLPKNRLQSSRLKRLIIEK